MPTLAEFRTFVSDLEAGVFPPCFKDREAAAQHLVDDICLAPWETAQERAEAQRLVARLLKFGYVRRSQLPIKATAKLPPVISARMPAAALAPR